MRSQHKDNISELFSNDLDLFLNNASRSPLPSTHQAIIQNYMNDWHHGKHEPYYYNFTHADALKQELSQFVHCTPNQIAIGSNVAHSFSTILHGYDWQPGDEVLLLSDDYPSVTLPFHSHPDIHIQWMNPSNGMATLDGIQKRITPRTVAMALSWVNYTTGQVNPMAEISALCKEKGIRLLVDATQALGVIPIDLTAIHVDFMVASLYKWCFCPQGISISIYSDSFLNDLSPISSGVFSQVDRGIRPTPNTPDASARKFEYGNLNILGIMLGHETFRWFNALGAPTIHHRLRTLSQGILQCLQHKDYAFPVDYSENHASSIVSFIHPNPEDFMTRLQNEGGQATVRHGLIRLSPGIYQTKTTIQHLDSFI